MFYNKATLWQGVGGGGGGSISFVSTANAGGYGVGSVTLNLTGTQAGDTVIILAHATRDSVSVASPVACTISGYTLKVQTTYTDNYSGLFWKTLTAADTTAVVTSNIVNNCTSAVAIVFRGANASPIQGSPTFTTGGFPSSQIDPPSITPTVAGSVVLALGSIAVDDPVVVIQSLSSGFSNPVFNNAPAGSKPAARCGICWKSWTTGAVDPGIFGLNYTNNSTGTLSMSAILLPA